MDQASPIRPLNDPQPDPEPIAPSLPAPDPGVFHPAPSKPNPSESEL
jgi:hypothetical protein